VRFAKYHGTGNDFVMVEDVDGTLHLDPALIAAVCARGPGVGADGVIRIVRGDASGGPGADFFMDYSNADGEPAEMCGNGIRCLAKYVFDRGLTSKTELDVDTRGGLKHLRLETDDGVVRRVTVDMGAPALERAAIPMTGDPAGTFVGQPLDVDGRPFLATAVSMGNPHVVLFVDPDENLGAMDVPLLGSLVEHLPLFPNRTNVEFVQPSGDRVRVRVWERGSGLTMACGTGACASLVACALAGVTGRESDLEFPGGLLHVAWREEDDRVLMTGPATHVFDAEISDDWLRQVADAGAGARAGAGAIR
jgi:diaminopimelate epimerase